MKESTDFPIYTWKEELETETCATYDILCTEPRTLILMGIPEMYGPINLINSHTNYEPKEHEDFLPNS